MMNRNVKIAKQLVKLAKSLIALDEEGDGSGFQYLHDMETYTSNEEKELNELNRAALKGKKYILYKQEHGLWRIRACKDFSDVKKGDLGGFVKSEDNLSHDGDCWVYDNARVYDHAEVYDNAKVYGKAVVAGLANVYGNARVFENVMVYGIANVYGNAKVYGDAEVYDRAEVYGNAKVYNKAQVHGHAHVFGKAQLDYEVFYGEITE